MLIRMGMTMVIWKWRPGWPFRFSSRIARAVYDDQAPLGLVRFDAQAIADELRGHFGGDSPVNIEVCDFTGHRANWILVECGWSVSDEAFMRLVNICTTHGLHVHAD
jgi:hypothetical protein